jgi:hypothetical protein
MFQENVKEWMSQMRKLFRALAPTGLETRVIKMQEKEGSACKLHVR